MDVIDRIIEHHNLTRSAPESVSFGIEPKWWPRSGELEKIKEVYKDEKEGSYYKYLWIDKEKWIVYFISGTM